MAKDKSLYKELRGLGVRKGRAAKLSSKLASRTGKERPAKVKAAVKDLRSAAKLLEERMRRDESRRDSARKAARTRRKKASKRSSAAKKLARSR